ncbi:MAG: TIR domain-containing protein [Candidatus Thiodiazotropha sp. (ex Lucinoma borealis)]|nr:TIR domain-containing protein [Candidatus Thiodiazotropha sp. (ex Lucinoma borealis)]
MKIFLSHSSSQKPLVREIRRHFPEHVDTWIDEQNLFIGDNFSSSLKEQVSEKSDYLLLFLDKDAAESQWVQKEVQWALEAERKQNRTILIVVLIDLEAFNILNMPELKKRHYLECADYSERAIEYVANAIVADLFALACRELESINNPSTKTKVNLIKNADDLLEIVAQKCVSLLFPYRQDNPISKEGFFDLFQKSSGEEITGVTLSELLDELFAKDLLPGVFYDGHELFILEEHYRWKAQINVDTKARVAKSAARMIRSGNIIALDAGSATDELVKIICSRLVSRSLANISIVTNSISAVEMLLKTSDTHGMDEHSCPFKLYLAGSFIRPNTRALVNIGDDDVCSFSGMLSKIGEADYGFIGVNGIDINAGLTTHEMAEVKNKRGIIYKSKKSIVLGDSTKIGIIGDAAFSSFDDDITVIVEKSEKSSALLDSLNERAAKLILV